MDAFDAQRQRMVIGGEISTTNGHGAGGENRTRVASLEGWSFTTKLHPLKLPRIHLKQNLLNSALTITGSPPAENKYGGQEWIRTTEGVCRRSYSPFPLATQAPALTPTRTPSGQEKTPGYPQG